MYSTSVLQCALRDLPFGAAAESTVPIVQLRLVRRALIRGYNERRFIHYVACVVPLGKLSDESRKEEK